MKFAKTMLASAAALGLVAAPIAAQAAPARSATPAGQSEQIGGGTILYVALAAFAIAMVILVADNDNKELPASP